MDSSQLRQPVEAGVQAGEGRVGGQIQLGQGIVPDVEPLQGGKDLDALQVGDAQAGQIQGLNGGQLVGGEQAVRARAAQVAPVQQPGTKGGVGKGGSVNGYAVGQGQPQRLGGRAGCRQNQQGGGQNGRNVPSLRVHKISSSRYVMCPVQGIAAKYNWIDRDCQGKI